MSNMMKINEQTLFKVNNKNTRTTRVAGIEDPVRHLQTKGNIFKWVLNPRLKL